MRSIVEGACGIEVNRYADAPSTVLTRGPPSRFAGQEKKTTRGAAHARPGVVAAPAACSRHHAYRRSLILSQRVNSLIASDTTPISAVSGKVAPKRRQRAET